ncbi:MAG: signal transduction histidine kinase, LytS [Rariglobus sp.]|jgi:LytS/YehU family sensor histidine kinase|nr:signal transduction histidine kinase, LytS [Rariglobus sp.]
MTLLTRLPPFWRFQLAGWTLLAVGAFPFKLVAFPSLSAVIAVTLTREPLGLLLSSLLRVIYRHVHRRAGRDFQFALVLIIASGVAGIIDITIGRIVSDLIGHPEAPLQTLGIFCFRSTLYISWSLLYFWLKAQRAARERELNLARAETRRREAELQLLRAQVNPHFLFNALNTILATLEPGQTGSRRVVEGLSAYLRYSLQHRHDALVPLGAEFDASVSYLAVEQERFRGELLVECSIEEAARDTPVPGVLIQPLVENAVKYSRQTSEPPYRVQLRVFAATPGSIRIEVTNSGDWVNPSASAGPHGTGLENLRGRLSLLYPDRHHLDIATNDGCVTVTASLSTGS